MAELYKDIYDCPVSSYHKCLEENDLKYLIKSGNYSDALLPELEKVFQKINDQKIDEFGVSPEFELYYYKLRDLNKIEIQALEGDSSAETTITILKNQIARLLKKKGDQNIRKYHARLHRAIQTHYQGRNSYSLTVFEFYNDVNDMIDDQRRRDAKEKAEKLNTRRRHG